MFEWDLRPMRNVPNWDEYFMGLAQAASVRSKDPHTQVGAVLVQDNRIIGTGYNGFAPGVPESFELWERPTKYQHVIHAEANCILHSIQPAVNAALYTTLFPCQECAKIIASIKIKRVVYHDDKYDNEISREIFRLKGIELVRCSRT